VLGSKIKNAVEFKIKNTVESWERRFVRFGTKSYILEYSPRGCWKSLENAGTWKKEGRWPIL